MLDDAAFPSHGHRVYVSIKDDILLDNNMAGSPKCWYAKRFR